MAQLPKDPSRLITLTAEGAIALVKQYAGEDLSLDGLKTLSDDAANALATHKGRLELDEIETLSDRAAIALAKHKGKLLLSGLKALSEKAAKALAKHKDLADVGAVARCLRRSRSATRPSALRKAREAGATTLRTVWNGHGDHGFFDHSFLARGKPIDLDLDVEQEVLDIVADNRFCIEGEMNGSVSVLEIDLATGNASFWDAQQADQLGRFAEFLLECGWAKVTAVHATLALSGDIGENGRGWEYVRERPPVGATATKASTTPAKGGRAIKRKLKELMWTISHIEGCDDPLLEVGRRCGREVSLEVDVASRTFVFRGRRKRVTIKVPANVLTITTFTVKI